jgi:hypothetical protein
MKKTLETVPVVSQIHPEVTLNVIRSLQELLYRESYYGIHTVVQNRLGLNEDEQNIVKTKLIEYINKL